MGLGYGSSANGLGCSRVDTEVLTMGLCDVSILRTNTRSRKWMLSTTASCGHMQLFEASRRWMMLVLNAKRLSGRVSAQVPRFPAECIADRMEIGSKVQ